MLFLKDLNAFHIDGKEIPCITAAGMPDHRCSGAPGSLYMDSNTGNLYICTGADTLQERYSWRIVGSVDDAMVEKTVSEYLSKYPVSGGGFTSVATALLITILQNAVFTTNQTANIAALQEALASGGSTGGDEPGDNPSGGETPDVPDVPDEPVADDITVADGSMTIVTVGSEISVSDGVMTIA